MEKEKLVQLLYILKMAYPKFGLFQDKNQIELWYTMLKDLDIRALELAIYEYISLEHYPPAISDIRQKVLNFGKGYKNWSDAYYLCKQKVRKYGHYRPKEAMEEIRLEDPIAFKTIRNLGYTEMCLTENIQAYRANFRDLYNMFCEQEKYQTFLPETIKKAYLNLSSLENNKEEKYDERS